MLLKLNTKKIFWLTVSGIIAGFTFLYLEDKIYDFLILPKYYPASIVPIVLIIGLYSIFSYVIIDPVNNFKLQRIHKEFSWYEIYLFTFLTAPLFSVILNSILHLLPLELKNRTLVEAFPTHTVLPIYLLLLCIYLLYYLLPKCKPQDEYKFACGSVGKDDDAFGYNTSAINVSKAILENKENISVMELFGKAGQGKSSYLRMIIENIDPSALLYTYISLTETNEASDFSRLFAERWTGTLASRYPILDCKTNIGIMKEITREVSAGIITSFISFLETYNKGLSDTKRWDRDEPVTKSVATTFNNIPTIHEKVWIIVIDELDRARLDELYRVIEVIERFKQLSMGGLPIRLVFILSIAREVLETNLTEESNKSWDSKLIRDFLFKNKSIDRVINLPPMDLHTNEGFIKKKIKDSFYFNKYLKDTARPLDVDGVMPNSLLSSDSRSLDNEDVIAYVIALLMEESPRVVINTFKQEDFLATALLEGKETNIKPFVRYGEFLLFSYITIRYPFLLDLFNMRAAQLAPESRGVDEWLLGDRLKKENKDIVQYVSEVTKQEINPSDRDIVKNILGVVDKRLIELKRERHTTNKQDISETESLSYPQNMYDMLRLVSSKDDLYRNSLQLYREHTKQIDKSFLNNVKPLDTFLSYARFTRNIYNPDPNVNKEVAEKLYDMFHKQLIKFDSYVGGFDSKYSTSTYEFIFALLELFENKKQNYKDIALTLLIKFLNDTKIKSEPKLMILSAFFKHESSSDINFRLTRSLEWLNEDQKKTLIETKNHVFDEVNSRYIHGKEDIYTEENFFYVMYQNWSGDPANTEEIENIRKCAFKYIDKHESAFFKYLEQLFYSEALESVSEIDGFHVSSNSIELYMPLQNLLQASNYFENSKEFIKVKKKVDFWRKAFEDKEQYKKYLELYRVNADNTTLRGLLMPKVATDEH